MFKDFWKKFNIFSKETQSDSPLDWDKMILDIQEKNKSSLSKSELRNIDREVFKYELNKKEVNPWAVCHAQGLEGDKFERCVMHIKESQGMKSMNKGIMDDTRHSPMHVDNTGGSYEDSELRLMDPFDSGEGLGEEKKSQLNKSTYKAVVQYSTDDGGKKEVPISVEASSENEAREKVKAQFYNKFPSQGGYFFEGIKYNHFDVSKSFTKGQISDEIKQVSNRLGKLMSSWNKKDRIGVFEGKEINWEDEIENLEEKLERLKRLQAMNREKTTKSISELQAKQLILDGKVDTLRRKLVTEDGMDRVEANDYIAQLRRRLVSKTISNRLDSYLKKEVGIDYAGPVPESKLARQDLENGMIPNDSQTSSEIETDVFHSEKDATPEELGTNTDIDPQKSQDEKASINLEIIRLNNEVLRARQNGDSKKEQELESKISQLEQKKKMAKSKIEKANKDLEVLDMIENLQAGIRSKIDDRKQENAKEIEDLVQQLDQLDDEYFGQMGDKINDFGGKFFNEIKENKVRPVQGEMPKKKKEVGDKSDDYWKGYRDVAKLTQKDAQVKIDYWHSDKGPSMKDSSNQDYLKGMEDALRDGSFKKSFSKSGRVYGNKFFTENEAYMDLARLVKENEGHVLQAYVDYSDDDGAFYACVTLGEKGVVKNKIIKSIESFIVKESVSKKIGDFFKDYAGENAHYLTPEVLNDNQETIKPKKKSPGSPRELQTINPKNY